ncbi:hypothetical protein [Phormidium sp. CCY1219]|uniref:hypothetical protein n=1 Tax=Phormidium sp. CCY1219 TaxID=2886104 RepID=UPI002D1EB665|nr:hypothetical protein [Phormidium sp. CCY1219]MEB3826205.1 hypothetical protein [Phormidium sp. CCY1219]
MKPLSLLSVVPIAASIALTPGSLLAMPMELRATGSAVTARRGNARGFPSFNSQRLDQQLVLYQNHLDRFGPPDVLIVGSSRSLQGVDPVALEKALAHYGYSGVNVFNFSINGATARVIDLVLRKILTPDQLPEMIIFADGVRAFNSGRVDRTYQAIVESEGYRLLSQGIRPLQSQALPPSASPGPTPDAIPGTKSVKAVANWRGGHRPGMQGKLDPVAGEGVGPVARMFYRRRRPETRPSLPPSQPPTPSDPTPSTPQQRPSLPTVQAVMAGQTPNQMQASGFFPVTSQFDPGRYYQQYRRVPGRYDGDYASFSLQGEQMAALEAIAQFARTRQIPLVVVNLPLSNDYLDSVRMASERQLRQRLQSMASREGFLFRDLGMLWPDRNDYFADPSHLNRYGAFAVSLHLAQDSSIPWSVAR